MNFRRAMPQPHYKKLDPLTVTHRSRFTRYQYLLHMYFYCISVDQRPIHLRSECPQDYVLFVSLPSSSLNIRLLQHSIMEFPAQLMR